MSRRLFLEGTVAGGACESGLALAPWPPTDRASPRPARSATSRSRWPSGRCTRPSFAKKIDNLDFPKIAREQYGIEGVEFVNQFFKDKAHDSDLPQGPEERAPTTSASPAS